MISFKKRVVEADGGLIAMKAEPAADSKVQDSSKIVRTKKSNIRKRTIDEDG